jgi:hypothetical protein
MIFAGTIRFFRYSCLTVIPVLAALAIAPVNAQTATPKAPNNSTEAQPIDPTSPNVLQPTSQTNNLLSLAGGQRLMTEASSAISSQNYPVAVKKLQEARQVFNQMSNFYQQLATNFSGIDNRVADSQRKKALDTAQMRDNATYQLALVHRAQNQPELAVPLLVQIVNSQNPTRDLGKKAYQQLFELGFVDTPYPRAGGNSTENAPQRSEATPSAQPEAAPTQQSQDKR